MIYPVPQGAEHDRESVTPAKMKLCPGFRNPIASKRTVGFSAAVRIFVSSKSRNSIFSKPSRFRSHVKCGDEALVFCEESRPAAN